MSSNKIHTRHYGKKLEKNYNDFRINKNKSKFTINIELVEVVNKIILENQNEFASVYNTKVPKQNFHFTETQNSLCYKWEVQFYKSEKIKRTLEFRILKFTLDRQRAKNLKLIADKAIFEYSNCIQIERIIFDTQTKLQIWKIGAMAEYKITKIIEEMSNSYKNFQVTCYPSSATEDQNDGIDLFVKFIKCQQVHTIPLQIKNDYCNEIQNHKRRYPNVPLIVAKGEQTRIEKKLIEIFYGYISGKIIFDENRP